MLRELARRGAAVAEVRRDATDTYVAIGMDRLVSFWRINKDRVQYDFNIKCLGSKVTKVAALTGDPVTSYVLKKFAGTYGSAMSRDGRYFGGGAAF